MEKRNVGDSRIQGSNVKERQRERERDVLALNELILEITLFHYVVKLVSCRPPTCERERVETAARGRRARESR